MIKQIAALHSFRGWLLTFGLLFAAIALIPILNIFVSEESFLHVPDYVPAPWEVFVLRHGGFGR